MEKKAIIDYLLPLQEIKLCPENEHKIEPLDYSSISN